LKDALGFWPSFLKKNFKKLKKLELKETSELIYRWGRFEIIFTGKDIKDKFLETYKHYYFTNIEKEEKEKENGSNA